MNAFNVHELLHHMILQNDPITTAELPSCSANTASHACAIGFSHSDLAQGGFVSLVKGWDSVAHEDHRVHIREHSGEFLLTSLEASNWLAELLSVQSISASSFIGTSSNACGNPSYLDSWMLQYIVSTSCKIKGFLESVVVWHKHIFQVYISTKDFKV